MNQLRSWLYGREIPSRWPPVTDSDSVENKNESSPSSAGNSLYKPNTPTTASSPLENDITDSSLRRFLLKVIPLQPGDCLGCKLVGTSVMVASGVIVMISARAGRARNPALQGQKLLMYNILCGSLFIGFQAAAISRFFDFGPFANVAKLQMHKNGEG